MTGAPNIRYVITNVDAEGELRVLTFPQQGRYTYATRGGAARSMELYREGLRRVLGDRISTLAVRAVECWPEHNDPKRGIWGLEEPTTEEENAT